MKAKIPISYIRKSVWFTSQLTDLCYSRSSFLGLHNIPCHQQKTIALVILTKRDFCSQTCTQFSVSSWLISIQGEFDTNTFQKYPTEMQLALFLSIFHQNSGIGPLDQRPSLDFFCSDWKLKQSRSRILKWEKRCYATKKRILHIFKRAHMYIRNKAKCSVHEIVWLANSLIKTGTHQYE